MIRRAAVAGALFALLAGAAARAADSAAIEAGAGHDNLDNGFDDWRSRYVSADWRPAPRRALYGLVRETERFGLDDTEALAGAYHPLTPSAVLLVEASASATSRVLPRWTLLAETEFTLANGFGAHAGLRRAEYDAATVNAGRFTLERYVAAWRVAYVATVSRLADAETAWTHVLSATRYYGDDNRAGLIVTRGEEVEGFGPAGVAVSDIRGFTLAGRQAVWRNWSATYEAGRVQQGDRYARKVLSLGLRRRF
jgi:YaiO family outer membrane protein